MIFFSDYNINTFTQHFFLNVHIFMKLLINKIYLIVFLLKQFKQYVKFVEKYICPTYFFLLAL